MQKRLLILFITIAGLWAQVQCWSYTDDFKIKVDTECLEMFPEELNAPIAGTGYTMIHWAAENGQKDEVELLISLGAVVKASDFFDNTPLHLVARNHKALSPQLMAQIAQILIEAGADPAARNANGFMPQDIAREAGNPYLTSFFEAQTEGAEDSYAPLIEHTKILWEEAEEEIDAAIDLVTTYRVAEIEYEIYRDRLRWIDIDNMRYPFILVRVDGGLMDCQYPENVRILDKISEIFYYNYAKSDQPDLSMCPISDAMRSDYTPTAFPSAEDIGLILVEAKRSAYGPGTDFDPVAFSLLDSLAGTGGGPTIATRQVSRRLSEVLTNLAQKNGRSYIDFIGGKLSQSLKDDYLKYKNRRFRRIRTADQADEKMEEIYTILDMKELALAVSILGEQKDSPNFQRVVTDEAFMGRLENSLYITLFKKWGNEIGRGDLATIATDFWSYPLVRRAIVGNIIGTEKTTAISQRIENAESMDREEMERLRSAFCQATEIFDSLREVPKHKDQFPASLAATYDSTKSPMRPSKITVRMNSESAEEAIAKGGDLLRFTNEPPYVVAPDGTVDIVVEYDNSGQPDTRTNRQAYEEALDSLWGTPELKAEKGILSIYPVVLDRGAIDPFDGSVIVKTGIFNNSREIRVLHDIELPKDVFVISPVPPYTIPPGGKVDLVLEFDPFHYSGRMVSTDVVLIFDKNEQKTFTFEAQVKRAQRGLDVQPTEFMLDSLDPYGGNVALLVNVRNNDKDPRKIREIALPKHLELITPKLPYTIPPFRSIDMVVELDPLGFEGMQVQKGFTILFDENDQERVTFEAVVGKATGNFLLSPERFDLGLMDASTEPTTMILRVENKDTEPRQLVGLSSIYELWLESPSLPHTLRPGEYVDIIIRFSPKDYVGRTVSGAFLLRFDKNEERKVGFTGEVEERKSGVVAKPEKIDLGTIEERGGYVSLRTTVWNNRNKPLNIEGITNVANLNVVHPRFPVKVKPFESQEIVLEFDPYHYPDPRFSKSFNLIFDNAPRIKIFFKGVIVDNMAEYRAQQEAVQSQQPKQPQPQTGDADELWTPGYGDYNNYTSYIDDLTSDIPQGKEPEPDMTNLSIMVHKDESWKNVDFRYIINRLLEKGAKVSMSGSGAKDDALVLVHTDIPDLDYVGRWVHEQILKSVGREPTEVHTQYMSAQAMGDFDVVIFLPKLKEAVEW